MNDCLYPIYSDVYKFTINNTSNFDKSHYKHVIIFYFDAKRVVDNYNIKYDKKIFMLAAFLYGIRNYKYSISINEDDLRKLITRHISNDSDIVLKIINIISCSKLSDKVERLEYPYNIYLDAILAANVIKI